MAVKLLSKEELIEALDLSKTYKYVYFCRDCKIAFGSESLNDNGICPRCESLRLKDKEKKDGSKRKS